MATESKEKKMSKSSERPMQAASSRLMSPFDEMDRMFDTFFGSRPRSLFSPMVSWPTWSTQMAPFEGRTPKVDVIDRDHEVVVKAELPGVKKENLDVTVGDNSITIRATTKQEAKEEKENYYRCEISSGEFMRTVGLPAAVDAEKAKAKFTDGVLEMTLPKIDGARRKTVKID